jgi:sigma-B regulation protein RsbU (phosphoserine phosphatase)
MEGTPIMTSPSAQFVAPAQADQFLLEVADTITNTLDLDTLMARVAELVLRIIPYEVFAILLLNEKTQELRIRFQIGHAKEVEKLRIRMGEGVTGAAAQRREPVLVNDVQKDSRYIGVPGIASELAIPLITKNKVIGVIDIEAAQPGFFNEEHQRLLALVASRIAVGIENARLYTRVARQAKTLTVLNEISREITSILHVDALLKRIGELLSRLIDYQMFSILELTDDGLVHRFSLRFKQAIQVKHDIQLGAGIVGYAALHREAVLVPDVTKDPRYIQINPETRSELAVPLIYKDRVLGVLDLEHTRRGYFTDEHVRTLTTMAGQVAIALENARLYERIEQQERRLQKDMQLARELQFRLLPPTFPKLRNAEVFARFLPARAIGGDLYDFVRYGAGECEPCTGLVIGDVSGKGAPAALYAAMVSGILRSHAGDQPGPAKIMGLINHSLAEHRIDGQFVSIIYALWNDELRELKIANSGLPRPVFVRDGELQRVEIMGLPLGLFDTVEHDEMTFECRPGDLMVFFSDGLVDATNRDGELFGRVGVERVIARNAHRSAEEVVNALFHAATKFADFSTPYDDQTAVALKISS